MAQLPPKAPTAVAPGLGGHRPPLWVSEFADFSAARRGSHRRSVSDSVAFFDVDGGGSAHDFDRLDDDQFTFIFADVQPPPPASSSPQSDHNSFNDEKPSEQQPRGGESEEPEGGCKGEPAAAPATETIVDPRRVKRILANRQSAQRSRVRKLHYISELERSVATLQMEVSALSPRVAFLDQQRTMLSVGNSHLKQRIAALAQDNIFRDAHQEALKKEIERLRYVHRQQNHKKMGGPTSDPSVHHKELLGCEAADTRICPPS